MKKDLMFPSLRSEVDRLFESLVHTAWGRDSGTRCWAPPTDVVEERDQYRIEMDVPGLQLADLSIEAEAGVLRVEGTRERTRHSEGERLHLIERSCGRFVRTFAVPGDVDVDGVRAQLRDGLLVIRLPKKGSGTVEGEAR